jgi:riboflavin kinase
LVATINIVEKALSRMRASRIFILLEILKLGGMRSHIKISSTELGERLGVTQQSVSNNLVKLEEEGLLERKRIGRSSGVKLTERGIDELSFLRADLDRGFGEGKGSLSFSGKVFTGLREGAYYISLPGYNRQIVSLLGFEPFPGTLNLKLSGEDVEKKRMLRLSGGLTVNGFEQGRRTFGGAKCFRAKVEGQHLAAALSIDRTHHDDTVLELISPHNLRRFLKLKDGDEVKVEVYLA